MARNIITSDVHVALLSTMDIPLTTIGFKEIEKEHDGSEKEEKEIEIKPPAMSRWLCGLSFCFGREKGRVTEEQQMQRVMSILIKRQSKIPKHSDIHMFDGSTTVKCSARALSMLKCALATDEMMAWKRLSSRELLAVLQQYPAEKKMVFWNLSPETLVPIPQLIKRLGRPQLDYIQMISDGLAVAIEMYLRDTSAKQGWFRPPREGSLLDEDAAVLRSRHHKYAMRLVSAPFAQTFFAGEMVSVALDLGLLPMIFAQCSPKWQTTVLF